MALERDLTFTEIHMLLAVKSLGKDAYGSAVCDFITERTGKSYAQATAYVVLSRLEECELLTSKVTKPRDVPGGRSRRIFKATPLGNAELKAALKAIEALKG